MKFNTKILIIALFSSSTFIIPSILGCKPPRVNYPRFEVNYLSSKKAKALKIKAQYGYEIKNGDTTNKTAIHYTKNGEIKNFSYFKYGIIPIVQKVTYDSISKTSTLSVYSEQELIMKTIKKQLENSWFSISTEYSLQPSYKETIYIKESSIFDSIRNEKTHYTYQYIPEDSIYNDTLSFCNSVDKYNTFNKVDTHILYSLTDTIFSIYTYDNQQRLISESSQSSIIRYNYTKDVLSSKEYMIDSILQNRTIIQSPPHIESTITYNDTLAIISNQIIKYDSLGLIREILNFGYKHNFTEFIKDTSYFDIVNNDTLFGLIENEYLELDYSLQPETLQFTYEFYD